MTDRKITDWKELWTCPACNVQLEDGVNFAIDDPKKSCLKAKAVVTCPHCDAVICERGISIMRLGKDSYTVVVVRF